MVTQNQKLKFYTYVKLYTLFLSVSQNNLLTDYTGFHWQNTATLNLG